ncbi:MAG TPA: mechanosensitive ion channel family protein [Blastocatellia bacterium]|nr:mechanosensitive ion channel family protein [Blastocatellia bacterium]
MDANPFYQQMLDKIPLAARTWLASSFIPALLILTMGLVAASLARRSLRVFINKTRIRTDPLLTSFFLRAVHSSILVVSLIAALGKAGVPVETFIAGLGITGIVIAFGLRDTISNLASGLFLLIYRPFRAGDTIEVDGSKGVVQELTIVNMQMTAADGVRVILPNSKVWGAKITNFSAADERRIEIVIKLRRRDVRTAIDIITRLLDHDDRMLKEPPPSVNVSSLADNDATITVWAWTKPPEFQPATTDQYLRILTALNEANIDTLDTA